MVIGVGTTFSIELPRAETAVRSESETLQARFSGLLVVLVENDRVVLDNMTHSLQDWGCRVIAASDWPELKSKLDRNPAHIDLILADFHLDGRMTGCDLITLLRQRQKSHIPSILLTGDVDVRHHSEEPSEGVVIAYKPVSSRRLAMLIYEITAMTMER